MSISSRPIKPLKKAPGPGKSPKIFSESLGLDHLRSLIDSISDKKDSEEDLKIQKSKEWEKKKKEAMRLKKLEKEGKDGVVKKRRKGAPPAAFELDAESRPVAGSNSQGLGANGQGKGKEAEKDTGSVHGVKILSKATVSFREEERLEKAGEDRLREASTKLNSCIFPRLFLVFFSSFS